MTSDFDGQRSGSFLSESGVPIFYRQWQPPAPAQATILIVHGLGEHGGRYRHLVGALLQAGYHVYAHDHQGFGRSGGARGFVNQFQDYLRDLTQVVALARLHNPGLPCCLYGHSMGGLISLYYLLEMPGAVDLAVIAAPALQAQLDLLNRFLKQVMILFNQVRPTLAIPQPGSFDVLSRDPEEVRLAAMDPLWVHKRSARWVVEILATMQEVAGRAPEIRQPILMLQGTADTVISPAATQEFFKHISSADKTLQIYEGYYHELHNDLGRARPINDLLEWLHAHCPTGGPAIV